MFKDINIKKFRGINALTIKDFKRINLFVGKNNCGKTSILEAILLLTGASNPEMPMRINALRELTNIDENFWLSIFNNMSSDRVINLDASLDSPEEKRFLTIKATKTQTMQDTSLQHKSILNETGLIKDNSLRTDLDINGLDLDFKLIKGSKNKETKQLKSSIFMDNRGVKFKVPDNYMEQRKAIFHKSTTLHSELAKKFDNIQIAKGTRQIVDILKKFDPSIENIMLGSDNKIYCDVGIERLIPINLLGDGILKVLSIITAVSNLKNGFLCIDEIENGLHYSAQQIIWDAIFTTANAFNVQIFATTHSMECVQAYVSSTPEDFKTNDDIRLFRIEKGNSDHIAIDYNYQYLAESIDSNWEIR